MKKLTLRLTAVLLAAAMLLGLSITGFGAEQKPVVILHTNDIHCAVDGEVGLAGVAAYKKELQAQYGEQNVLLVDAGDAVQGEVIGTLSNGVYPLELMNEAGYDLAAPGNHEFDYGFPQFLALVEQAKFPYLCSNLTELATGKTVLPAYAIRDCGGVKIAFVGIATPQTLTKAAPVYFQDGKGNYLYSFAQGENGRQLYNAVQQAVDGARADGAEYVVAVGHLGINGVDPAWQSTAVIANTTGIDILIDGHSHEQYEMSVKNKDGKEVVLAQTGTKLAAVGRVVIDPANGGITHELVDGLTTKDAQVEAKLKEIQEKYHAEVSRVVASSAVALTTLDPATGERMVRSRETNLGDLCADAYRIMTGADVGFMNGGGIRADLSAGSITYGDLINVNPYNNSICMVKVTGQQILDALEFSARFLPEESGGFLHVSGLRYTIDMGVAPSIETDVNKAFVRVTGPYRVKDVTVGGAPLDPAKTYTLASHNYMLKDGGDGFSMFAGCEMPLDSVMLDNQALIRYISDALGGTVGTEYADPYGQGRIKILPSDNAVSFPAANASVNVSTGAAA